MISDDIFGSPDEVLAEDESVKTQLDLAMEGLSDREKDIVCSYFGIFGEQLVMNMT
jgi:DNA-directed RNA polymerase sigma subunit (sigma70/sigma32)